MWLQYHRNLSFLVVFDGAEMYDVFGENKVMSLQWGFPHENWGNPPKFREFQGPHIRLVMCMPITKLNDTIPVLFKTLI